MSISGHEPQFRALFAEQSGPELDRLARNLLALESAHGDAELVNSLFRDAHNLKGGAAMVGLDEVRLLAHAMEDVLEPLRGGEIAPTAQIVDRLLAAVDAVRALVPALVSGQQHGVDVGGVEATLREVIPSAPPAGTVPQPPAPQPPAPQPQPQPRPVAPQPHGAAINRTGTHDAGGSRPAGPAATMQVPVTRLDDIARLVGEGTGAHVRLGQRLTQQLGVDPSGVAEFRELSMVLGELRERATRSRMVPVAAVAETLQRVARDVARGQGKQVRWSADGTDTELDSGVLEQLADPLLHLVRNAVDHGIEPPQERLAAGKPAHGEVRLHARQAGPDIVITIRDDGRGIDTRRVRAAAGAQSGDDGTASDEESLYLIFRTGLSTADEVTDVSGRGVGMDVVRTNIEAVRGRIEVQSQLGRFTEFRISVPITLTVLRCLVVSCAGERYAIPLHTVVTVLPPRESDITCEDYPVVWVGERTVPVSGLAETLNSAAAPEHGPAVILAGLTRQHAFRIGELLGQRDVVIKGLSGLLPRLSSYTGVSAEADGSVLLVLDSSGLIEQARRRQRTPGGPPPAGSESASTLDSAPPGRQASTILVVDDALTVRELQRAILERAGYTVLTAADGVAALAIAESTPVDLVLTDVQMPHMDGLELTRALRAHPKLGAIGIVVLTSLGTDEDRRRGLDAGADGYIAKNQFDEQKLIDSVQRILGEPA